jgi:protein gp37
MAEHTLIEWARHPVTGIGATWNIVTGCDIVSPGCTNCYAMKLAGTRLRHHPSRQGLTVQTKVGPVWNGEVRFNEQWLTQPLTWKKPHGIFVAAHGDLFADGVTDDHLDRIFAVMALCPQHIFYVLTKRPERMREYLTNGSHEIIAQQIEEMGREAEARLMGKRSMRATADVRLSTDAFATSFNIMHGYAQWPLPNVWLGVSVEDQKRADERIPVLLDTPAAIRFISAEPLIGPINIVDAMWAGDSRPTDNLFASLDWVIAGGESGPRAMHPDWAISLRDQCADANVAFFFKQWGSWLPVTHDDGQISYGRHTLHQFADGLHSYKVGKSAAGRELLGRTHDEYPEIPA